MCLRDSSLYDSVPRMTGGGGLLADEAAAVAVAAAVSFFFSVLPLIVSETVEAALFVLPLFDASFILTSPSVSVSAVVLVVGLSLLLLLLFLLLPGLLVVALLVLLDASVVMVSPFVVAVCGLFLLLFFVIFFVEVEDPGGAATATAAAATDDDSSFSLDAAGRAAGLLVGCSNKVNFVVSLFFEEDGAVVSVGDDLSCITQEGKRKRLKGRKRKSSKDSF
mmetsp:Transcript_8972/g.17980  ORF Transcript_8972/g.17980 Transcript_8972/m.17980 type:complete len:221 (+) Transcript_8972:1708-2370(+)